MHEREIRTLTDGLKEGRQREALAPGDIRIAKCKKKTNRKMLLGFHMINTLWDLPKELKSKHFKIGSSPARRHVSDFLCFKLKRKLKTSARSGLYQPTDPNHFLLELIQKKPCPVLGKY